MRGSAYGLCPQEILPAHTSISAVSIVAGDLGDELLSWHIRSPNSPLIRSPPEADQKGVHQNLRQVRGHAWNDCQPNRPLQQVGQAIEHCDCNG